jgi:hypothetical protein
MILDILALRIERLCNSWDDSFSHFVANFAPQFKFLYDHLSNLVEHLHNMHVFGFGHLVIETFREVVVDIVYLTVL